jgi:hypothetical protein
LYHSAPILEQQAEFHDETPAASDAVDIDDTSAASDAVNIDNTSAADAIGNCVASDPRNRSTANSTK